MSWKCRFQSSLPNTFFNDFFSFVHQESFKYCPCGQLNLSLQLADTDKTFFPTTNFFVCFCCNVYLALLHVLYCQCCSTNLFHWNKLSMACTAPLFLWAHPCHLSFLSYKMTERNPIQGGVFRNRAQCALLLGCFYCHVLMEGEGGKTGSCHDSKVVFTILEITRFTEYTSITIHRSRQKGFEDFFTIHGPHLGQSRSRKNNLAPLFHLVCSRSAWRVSYSPVTFCFWGSLLVCCRVVDRKN